MKLKCGDRWGDLTAIQWREQKDIYILMNVHDVPAEGNFCNKQGNSSSNTGTGVHVASCKSYTGDYFPSS